MERTGRVPTRRWLPLGLALCTMAACGSPDSGSAVSPSLSSTTAATASTAATSPGTSTGGLTASSTSRSAAARSLPGEPYDHGPASGQGLAVVGVAAGSTLPVREHPDPAGPVVARLSALATTAVATGRSRLVTPAPPGGGGGASATVWAEVRTGGTIGWADARFLAIPADTVDLTAEVIERLGRRPAAETMLDLGKEVASAYVSAEPPSTVTVSVAPTVGDLGEITVDVVGLGDDSVAAQRLHVFGTPGVESFTLKSVEGTPFCSRGVSADGLCL